jgi:hypothetical protein
MNLQMIVTNHLFLPWLFLYVKEGEFYIDSSYHLFRFTARD